MNNWYVSARWNTSWASPAGSGWWASSVRTATTYLLCRALSLDEFRTITPNVWDRLELKAALHNEVTAGVVFVLLTIMFLFLFPLRRDFWVLQTKETLRWGTLCLWCSLVFARLVISSYISPCMRLDVELRLHDESPVAVFARYVHELFVFHLL